MNPDYIMEENISQHPMRSTRRVKRPRERKPPKERNTEGRGVRMHPQMMRVAVKVYHFFQAEAQCQELYEKPLIPYTKVYERACKALGISRRSMAKCMKDISDEQRDTAINTLLKLQEDKEIDSSKLLNTASCESILRSRLVQKKKSKRYISSNVPDDFQTMVKDIKMKMNCKCKGDIGTQTNTYEDFSIEETVSNAKARLERQSYLMQMCAQNNTASTDMDYEDNTSDSNSDSTEELYEDIPLSMCDVELAEEVEPNSLSNIDENNQHTEDNIVKPFSTSEVRSDYTNTTSKVKTAKTNTNLLLQSKLAKSNATSSTSVESENNGQRNIIVPVRIGPKGALSNEVVVRVGSKEIVLPVKNLRKVQASNYQAISQRPTPKNKKIILNLDRLEKMAAASETKSTTQQQEGSTPNSSNMAQTC